MTFNLMLIGDFTNWFLIICPVVSFLRFISRVNSIALVAFSGAQQIRRDAKYFIEEERIQRLQIAKEIEKKSCTTRFVPCSLSVICLGPVVLFIYLGVGTLDNRPAWAKI